MAQFERITYVGKEIKIKEKELSVDGYCIDGISPDTEKFIISGEGNIICDQTVIVNADFKGTITAKEVIVNGNITGDIKADKVIYNEK